MAPLWQATRRLREAGCDRLEARAGLNQERLPGAAEAAAALFAADPGRRISALIPVDGAR